MICDDYESCMFLFKINERVYLDLLRNDYSRMLNHELYNDYSATNQNVYNKYYIHSLQPKYLREIYKDDSTSQFLRKQVLLHQDEIIININHANLSEQVKDFIILFFKYTLLLDEPCNEKLSNEVYNAAESFLSKYPKSEYYNMVKSNMYFKFSESNWALGAYIYTGLLENTGELHKYVSDAVPLNIGYETQYKKFRLHLGLGASFFGKINRYFFYQTNWNKGNIATYLNADLTLGYDVINNKHINLTPFAGIAKYGVIPKHRTDSFGNPVNNLSGKGLLYYGFNIDYKFKFRNTCLQAKGSPIQFKFIRFRFGYYDPEMNKVIKAFSGKTLFFNIGVGFYEKESKKIKGSVIR